MRRKILLVIAAAGCLSLLTACSSQKEVQRDVAAEEEQMSETGMGDGDSDGAYHKISAKEAKEMIDGGDVTIVDVRTEDEYAEEHIPDAILVPNETIGDEAPAALPDKSAVLLIHCRTGVRSKEASDKLVELGYQNVYDFGGIVDWEYETVRQTSGGS